MPENEEMLDISEFVRTTFGKNDDERDRGLQEPEDVSCLKDITYGSSLPWQLLDVYRPAGSQMEDLPVIVSVHGGGWVYGDKERYRFYCMDLSRRGFAVINFSYRLAPEFRFPASLEDTCSVFAWVLAHAQEQHFDRSRIFAVGDSAGAHILGLFTAMCVNPVYAASFPFSPPEAFVPRRVAFNCGAYWVRISDLPEDQLPGSIMKVFLPKQGTPEELELIDLRRHITGDFPDVFFMTAEDDFLSWQTADLADALSRHGIPFVYRYYRNRNYKLGHVFHLNIRLEEAKLCSDEECAFFHSL